MALLRIEPGGEADVEAAFHKLGTEVNDLRLRAEIIHRLYGRPFGPDEVAKLLTGISESAGSENISGVLWSLPDDMPLDDIPAVLDGLELNRDEFGPGGPHEREAARFIDRLLIRVWRGIANIEPGRALSWLRLRHSYSRGHRGGRTDDLRTTVHEGLERLGAMTDHFLETLVPDKEAWWQLMRFREVTFFQVTPKALCERMTAHMTLATVGGEKELFLYDAALAMTFSMDGAEADAAFQKLFELADSRADLREIRERLISCKIPHGLLDHRSPVDVPEDDPASLRQRFEEDADAIRSGLHLDWLSWAAQIYFSQFADVDENAPPRERLVSALGEANAQTTIEGFIAALGRSDLPLLDEVVALSVAHKLYKRWWVPAAGLIEQWAVNQDFTGLSDELLKAMLAFDLGNPAFEHVDGSSQVKVPGWKTAVLRDRPELARDAYAAMARAKLTKGDPMVTGLRELMTEDAFKSFRADTVLDFLRDFPNADPFRLDELLDGVFATPAAHSGFLVIAERVLSGAVAVDPRQHDIWFAAAYLLSPGRYETGLEVAAAQRPALVFHLRDHSGHDRRGSQPSDAMRLPQLEFLARLTGSLYPETGFPTGVFGGDTNAWDAAEYCRKLINGISAIPSEAATDALRRLEADPRIASYNAHMRHALANQERRRRDSEYDRPDWTSTVRALSNGAPATVADLHALLLDELDELRKRIARENTDIYKQFWNVDRYSRLDKPRPKEACRDTLVTLLRPALAPKGITVEPEGHMVADKRADISAAMPARKILCELKRDYHADLWTAADAQLERFYAHDPEAKGFGIYCVFWFGDRRPRPIPKHPDGFNPPRSAPELEQMLRERMPADRRNRLAVLVIDVSDPPA
jgi:hypothetical protein